MDPFSSVLSGGDRRSVGDADKVAETVVSDPGRFDELWACLIHADPLVRMRAADALEKATRTDATKLQRHRRALLTGQHEDGTKELRWHLIAMCGRLQLDPDEARALMNRLDRLMAQDRSRIVKVMALQTAVELGERHAALAGDATRMIAAAKRSDIASLRARARKLASRLQA